MSLFRASHPNKSLSVAKFVVSSRSSLVSLVTGLVFLATATNSYGQFFYSSRHSTNHIFVSSDFSPTTIGFSLPVLDNVLSYLIALQDSVNQHATYV